MNNMNPFRLDIAEQLLDGVSLATIQEQIAAQRATLGDDKEEDPISCSDIYEELYERMDHNTLDPDLHTLVLLSDSLFQTLESNFRPVLSAIPPQYGRDIFLRSFDLFMTSLCIAVLETQKQRERSPHETA